MWGILLFFVAVGRDCEPRVRSVRPQEGKRKRRLIGWSNACRFAAVLPPLFVCGGEDENPPGEMRASESSLGLWPRNDRKNRFGIDNCIGIRYNAYIGSRYNGDRVKGTIICQIPH